MKAVLIINGLAGTGSTTTARLLKQRLGLQHVHSGAKFRALAKQANQSIEQFNIALADDQERERAIDDSLIARARRGNAIIESRVLAWLLPTDIPALKVCLTCQRVERVRRVDQREGTDNAHRRVEQRERSEAKRYRDLYDIDVTDLSVFDLVIDTTKLPPQTVADRVEAAYKQPAG